MTSARYEVTVLAGVAIIACDGGWESWEKTTCYSVLCCERECQPRGALELVRLGGFAFRLIFSRLNSHEFSYRYSTDRNVCATG
jgi:hypothetical protein